MAVHIISVNALQTRIASFEKVSREACLVWDGPDC